MHVRRAFTLVELLVVIAIITLLVSILMPSLHRSRLLANAAGCMVNLRSITLNILTYASDNNEYAVPFLIGKSQNYWTHPDEFFVKDYLGGENVLRCPSVGPPYEWTVDWKYVYPRNLSPSPNRWYEGDRLSGAFFDYATTTEYCTPDVRGSQWWFRDYWPPAPLNKHHGDVHPTLPGRLVGTPPSQSHLIYDNRNSGPCNFESSDTYVGGQEMKAPRHIDGQTAQVGYVDGHVARFRPLVFSGWPATIPH